MKAVKGLLTAAMLSACIWMPSEARADIFVDNPAAVTPVPGGFKYDHPVFLVPGGLSGTFWDPAGGGNNPGNWFTLDDVEGLVIGSATFSGPIFLTPGYSVAITYPALGALPPGTLPLPPGDTAALFNIQVTLTSIGAPGPITSVGVPTFLGTLSYTSLFDISPVSNVPYQGATQRLDTGEAANNSSIVKGPSFIPEPSSLALLGLGAPALVVVYLRLRRRKA